MGIFAKKNIGNARGSRGGLYLEPGNYVVQVQRCKEETGFKGDEFFITELEVIESNVEKLPPGSAPSYVVNMKGKFPDLALGNCADFMRAGFASLADQSGEDRPSDIDDIELDDDMAEAVISEENLLAGVFLSVKAWHKDTRDGGVFTRVKWGVPDNLTELASAA
jgi:hypothetical protein